MENFKIELTPKGENGFQQLISAFNDIWGLDREQALAIFSNVCFHSEVQEAVFEWTWYELTGKLPEEIKEVKKPKISPATKILLTEAQKEIDRGKERVKILMNEIRDYEKTVSRLRAEVKSLKMELKQND
jgi:peptidoglycan hydrolase CwlO-like protein